MDEITNLLRQIEAGEPHASSQLFELIYATLKRMAYSRVGQHGHMELNATSLVHESFLRLTQLGHMHASDRASFFGYVGRVMRSVVIDHVRAQQALKRGGAMHLVTLTTGVAGDSLHDAQLLSLNAALDRLEQISPESSTLLDMRYFAGLSVREVAELRGTSTRTIEREWRKARAFLRELMDPSS